MALALLAIALATWSATTFEHGEASTDLGPTSAVATPPTMLAPVTSPDPRADLYVYSSRETDLRSAYESATAASDVPSGPPLSVARILNVPVTAAGGRSSSVLASSGPLPLSIDERLEAGDLSGFVVAGSSNPLPELTPGDLVEATISFYYCEQGDAAHGGDGGGFCGPMRDGTVVYEGAAACDYVYLGQRFRILGDPSNRIYTCHDTGSAVHGLHRDIFFYNAESGWPWLLTVGTDVVLEIVD
jgi:hypothetical protein